MPETSGLGAAEGGFAALLVAMLGTITGYTRLSGKVKEHDTRLNDHANRVREAETDLAVVKSRAKGIDDKLLKIEEKIDKLIERGA